MTADDDGISQSVLEHHNRVLARMEVVREAFAQVGLTLGPSDRFNLIRVAEWGHFVDDDLKVQDGRSRQLVEIVEAKANELQSALEAAWNYAGLPTDEEDGEIEEEPESDRVNVCRRLFNPLSEEDGDSYRLATDAYLIAYRASHALRQGRRSGRGRPPLFAYYRFIHDLYAVYRGRVNSRGFHEKDGTARGPFVAIVKAAQAILPDGVRIKTPTDTLIGNRVLQAFHPSAFLPEHPPPEPFKPSYRILSDDDTGDIPAND